VGGETPIPLTKEISNQRLRVDLRFTATELLEWRFHTVCRELLYNWSVYQMYLGKDGKLTGVHTYLHHGGAPQTIYLGGVSCSLTLTASLPQLSPGAKSSPTNSHCCTRHVAHTP
jgi:hypothetical protein